MEILITIIIWASLLQGLLLSVIFITSRKHRSFANSLLGYFILTFVFAALTDLLPFGEIGNYSISGYFTLPEVKLLFPLLFLHFILEKVGRTSSYRVFLKIHYLLAFGIICITCINMALFLFSGKTILDLLGWNLLDSFYMGQQYYAFLLTLGVFIISLKEIFRYRNLVRNEFTDMGLLNINWLWQYNLAIAPIILFWGAELLRIVLGGRGQSSLTIIAYVFIAVFIYFVSYKAFTQQTLFDSPNKSLKASKANAMTPHKVSAKVEADISSKIIKRMEAKQYYLNQNLTLHEFAKEIQISPRTISSCINQNLGLNFNEWVNHYRVDKAQEMMNSDTKNQLSIEGIGFDAGFKSRSAMYTAFKKKLGYAPGHFR